MSEPTKRRAQSETETGEMRLHRFLAQCGIASRRKAEEIILEGRVEVNGEVILELGSKVIPGDKVVVDGRPVGAPDSRLYLFNKPLGVLTTMSDDRGRPTVADHIPQPSQGIKPVGRLDMNTQGLLFLTNDGDLAHRLTHPRYGIEKEYVATVRGVPNDKTLARLCRGIFVDGAKTLPSRWEIISVLKGEDQTKLRIILHEGRNRQIRKMADLVGHPVASLRRVRIGNFTVKGMSEGEMRLIGKKDHEALRKKVGL